MHELFGWFQALTDFIFLFIPRRIIVRATDKLIKFKWDGSTTEEGPGLRWYLPLTTEITEITTVRQPLDIRPIRFVTKDYVPCIVDCTVTYYITDATTFLTCNFDGHLALSECISSTLRKKLSSMTFSEIQNSSSINDELTVEVENDVESFGIEVEYIRLQDLTYVIPISIITNNENNKIVTQ